MNQENNVSLDKNTASALTYVLGPITGVIFFIIDKRSAVRFHAVQSILVFGAVFVLQFLLAATILLAFLLPLISLATFVLWLVLIYKAWSGEDFEVPFFGQYAKKWMNKI